MLHDRFNLSMFCAKYLYEAVARSFRQKIQQAGLMKLVSTFESIQDLRRYSRVMVLRPCALQSASIIVAAIVFMAVFDG